MEPRRCPHQPKRELHQRKGRQHLHQCLASFGDRERRFGLTSAQLASDVEGA
jgi:hypothetical protein